MHKQCPNGHFYDAALHAACPVCQSGQPAAPFPPTPASPFPPEAPRAESAQISLTVGWLVVSRGEERGRTYPLHTDNNFIGCGAQNDVRLARDRRVTEDTNAFISYDNRRRAFHLVVQTARTLVRRNGDPVYQDVTLSAHDRLEIGETELVFVPLSCEKFDWDWDA